MGEIDQLAKELGLETETVEINFEKLEKQEMYENIKKITEALANNQNILLELLNAIMKKQEEIRQAISQLALTRVTEKGRKRQPGVPSPIPPPTQIPIDWRHSYYKTTAEPQTPTFTWKAFAWQKKPWMR